MLVNEHGTCVLRLLHVGVLLWSLLFFRIGFFLCYFIF